ncbi:MAG: S8 family serine peptidase [Planctomycetota bacterium]
MRSHLVTGLMIALLTSLVSSRSDAREDNPHAAWVGDRSAKQALEANPDLEFAPNRVLVRFAPSASFELRSQARALVGGWAHEELGSVQGLERLYVGVALHQALHALNSLPFVQYAELDYVVHPDVLPNDTYFNVEWGLHNTGQTIQGVTGVPDADIDAPEAWDTFTGSASFTIAIIDTGTQYTHPDLDANIWANTGEIGGNGIDDDGNGYADDIRGWDFYDVDNDPNDTNGHGTHTAGTVGAESNNGLGVAGVNWQCKLMALRFIGPFGGYTSDAILAVNYAASNGARVSNNSWGGGGYSQGLYDAIANAGAQGHIFVAAAGNYSSNNDSSPFYPASYTCPNIIAVAATDNRDQLASFSNYGATSVDIGGPGVDVVSTYPTNSYAYLSGTSMACPHVAGVTALVYAWNPGWTYQQVRDQVLNTARPIPALAGKTVTGGVVNAQAALGGGPGNTPPVVTITAPADGTTVIEGTPVTFTGTASDAEDGNLDSALVWTSSLQGQIGTGPSFTRSDLAVGTHQITASVTDSGGLNGSDQITLTVQVDPGSTPPAMPGQPVVTSLGGGSVRVSWADSSNNEDGFRIERQKRVGKNWTNTTTFTFGANVTSFIDNPGAGRFRYRAQAFNAAGSSSWTGWTQVKVR